MTDSNSCQRKTVGFRQLSGLLLSTFLSCYTVWLDKYPQNVSLRMLSLSPKFSGFIEYAESKVLLFHMDLIIWIIPTHSMYKPAKPNNYPFLLCIPGFPFISSCFTLFSTHMPFCSLTQVKILPSLLAPIQMQLVPVLPDLLLKLP